MNPRTWIPLAALVAFVALTVYAVASHGYVGLFQAALANAATVQVSVDLVIALALVLTWMAVDARERGMPLLPYLAATLFLGSIGPLAYLVHRGLAERRGATA